ncbi:MAG: hypothetical protein U0984_02565 [Prosthecobacter sp.]|nr:hypothetical protein [Prosthecobacter sp.]
MDDPNDDSLFKNVHRHKNRSGRAKTPWLASGAAVTVVGLLFLPTIFMTSIGLALIGVGVAMMVVGALRTLRSASAKAVKSKYVR